MVLFPFPRSPLCVLARRHALDGGASGAHAGHDGDPFMHDVPSVCRMRGCRNTTAPINVPMAEPATTSKLNTRSQHAQNITRIHGERHSVHVCRKLRCFSLAWQNRARSHSCVVWHGYTRYKEPSVRRLARLHPVSSKEQNGFDVLFLFLSYSVYEAKVTKIHLHTSFLHV